MRFSALLIAVAALAIASPALGLTTEGRAGGPENAFNHNHGMASEVPGEPQNVRNALVLLRAEGQSLTSEDGGTLTPEHRQYLQTKLDGILRKRLVNRHDL
jgi:hypothetical protein